MRPGAKGEPLKTIAREDPIDIATEATASFIESVVPRYASILEIGCGDGHVAIALAKRNYVVVGVESDPAAVLRARRSGADVILGAWPKVNVEPVNAVVFTRSLHHISPLPEAISRIREILLPQGAVLVEDFAFDAISPQAITWLLGIVASPRGRALISHDSNSLVTKLLNADDPVGAWRQDHDHDLHSFEGMTQAIAKHFVVRDINHVPYLYRYLIEVLPRTPEAAAFIAEVLTEETELGKSGEISLIGRRIFALAP